MEEKKNNKGLIWLIVSLITLVLGIGIFLLSKKEAINTPKTEEEKKYSLKKLTDFDFKVSQVEFFESIDDYIALKVRGSDGLYSSIEKLLIIKGEKKVYESTENETGIFRTKDKNIYYNSNGIINFKTSEKSYEKYDSIDIHNNIFIATKNNKYALIDSEDKKITEFIYDKIEGRDLTSKYLFVVKENKVGIIDINGNVIVPIQYDIEVKDYDGYEYNDYGQIIKDNDKNYFILKQEDKNYIFDETKKNVLETEADIYYDYNLNYFYTVNNNIYSYYSIDGKHKKDVEINPDWSMSGRDYVSNVPGDTEDNFVIFQDSKDEAIIYELNKDLEMKTYHDVYFYQIEGMDDFVDVYYFNNNFYVVKKEDNYEVISKNNARILGEYSKIQYVDLSMSDDNDLENVFVACKSDKECGLLDITGKAKTEFKYEYTAHSHYPTWGYGILRNGKENIILSPNDKIETMVCDKDKNIEHDVWGAHKNAYKTDDDIYSNKCEKMNEKSVRNYDYLENNYIVAEIEEECSFDNEMKCNYYIWDNNNKLINYENKDIAIIYSYLGFANNKMYFKTDKGIYFIDTE